MTQEEILKYAVESGMLALNEISEKANIGLIQKVKETHRFNIAKLCDGRYGTWVQDESAKNGRRNIKAATRSWNPMGNKALHEYGASERIGSPESV
ncbi:MAG: hypothetical protein LBT06_11575 [Hungatella sp.]|nr:hypothetical protein [Hungatella sp.]